MATNDSGILSDGWSSWPSPWVPEVIDEQSDVSCEILKMEAVEPDILLNRRYYYVNFTKLQ